MTVSNDISSLTKKYEPYTAKASIGDGGVDNSTTKLTGDRTSDLAAGASSEMGKDDFLTLLVTQMRYQDPLNPMDNTQFVSQLAQFRALENSSNMEAAIAKLDDSFKGTVSAQTNSAQSISNTAAVSLIGKQVRLKDTKIEWSASAGAKVPIQVSLGDSETGTIEILDSDEKVVKTIKASGKDSQNSVKVNWDGSTDAGQIAKSGSYSIRMVGQDKNAALYSFVQDVVEGVRFSASGALIKVGGKELSIGNVMDVSTSESGGSMLTSVTPTTAVALLGKDVRVRESEIYFHGLKNEVQTVKINTDGYEDVQVDLTDENGTIVYSANVKADTTGIATFSWNGATIDKGLAPTGKYAISIQGEESDPAIYAFSEGRIEGISNATGGTQLRINGKLMNVSDIIDIGLST